MTACSARLQSLEYVAEGSWAEVSTDMSSAVRIPTTEVVSISGLTHEMVSPSRVVQFRNQTTKGIPGKQGGSFSFTVYLCGRGSTSAGAVSLSPLSNLLGWAHASNTLSASSGTDIDGGSSTATALTTTASATFAAGSLFRVGAKGDGGGDGQWAVVGSHATTTLTTLTALPAAPVDGAIVYAADNVYPSETTCAVSSRRFQILTADTQWVAHGCYPMGVVYDIPIGGIATAKVTVGVSWFEPVSTTFPSAKSVTTDTPAPVAAGSVFFQTVGTATRATLSVRSFSVSYTLGIAPIMGLDGVSPYQSTIGASRTPDACTVAMVVDAAGASSSPTYWADWLTNAGKHLLFSASTADGQAWAMYFPQLFWDGNRPTQEESDGLNRLSLNLKASTGPTTTTDLTASMFRLGLA